MTGPLTLGRWILDRERVTPDREAIVFGDEAVTYADLAFQARGLSAELRERGLRPGDRVAVLSSNRPEYVSIFFACALGGYVLTPLNWRLTSHELAYQVDDSEPSLFIVEESRIDQAQGVLELTSGKVEVRRLEEPFRAGSHIAEVADDHPLLIVYTSGTTGHPKGAVLTHANCFWTNISIDRVMDVASHDVVLQILPQFHVGGWNVQPLLALWKGARIILESDFDPDRALRLISDHRVTTMMGVPANYLFMAESPTFANADLSSLRMAVVGGAPMPESLIETWHERGVSLVQGYGLTEASPNVLGLPPEYVAEKVGYAGKAYPHVEADLWKLDNTGRVDGPGIGELIVRGPSVFAGYWRNPEATSDTLRDGWLHTGDIAERDEEGFFRIRDRIKDMYISGGENVYPAEVEEVLHAHPDIVEAAVIGVPDEKWGESGTAFVVVRPGADLDEAGVRSWCRERLATYKVPKRVRFAPQLPRSGAAKVLKRQLQEMEAASS